MTTTTERPGARAAVVDAVVLTSAVGLALLPLVPVYGGTAVMAPVVGGLLLGAVTALVAAVRRWSVLATAAVTLVLYLVAGAALAAPTTTVWRVLPTPASVVELLPAIVTVWKDVLTLDPSLGSVGSVLAAPYLLALVGTSVAVGLAVRTRRAGPWAALVPLLVLVVSVLLGTKTPVAAAPAGALLAVLLGLWASVRAGARTGRRPVAAAAMVAVVAVGGALAGPVLADANPRLVLRDELVPPFDPRDHPSPLSGFRTFVKDWADKDLLTVSGLPDGARVRLATLDAFDGVVWDVAGAEAAEGSGRFRRVGETIATSVRGTRATVEVEVHDLPLVWLPTVGWARTIDFAGPRATELAADLRYNDATGAAVLPDGVPAGTRWTADVVVPEQPTDEEIGTARAADVALPEARAVPDAVPLFAGEVAGTATSPVLIARSLEQGLAERGWFSHGQVDSGQAPSLSGHGADRITTLLTGDRMVGDHEQYASAMALMAREMGLPARVVLGFVPPGGTDGDDPAAPGDEAGPEASSGSVTFTGDDVAAWVEIAFEGHGWVTFDPTPPESRTPSEDTPEDASEPQPQVVQPPPPPEEPVTPPQEDTERARTEDTREDQQQTGWFWRALGYAALAALPVLVVVSPFLLVVLLKRRRRRRRRAAGTTVERVVGGWDEVLDHATDLRRGVPPTATRREAAVHLARAFAGDGRDSSEDRSRRAARVGAPVARLAAHADGLVFGPGDPSADQVDRYWGVVDEAVRAMRSSVPARRRWAGAVSPASLRRRRRARGRPRVGRR